MSEHTVSSPAPDPADDERVAAPTSIGETCCGACPGATCYVDFITGEREA